LAGPDLARYRIRPDPKWFYLLPEVYKYLRVWSWLHLDAYRSLRPLGGRDHNGLDG
jgi:hypothetical protein